MGPIERFDLYRRAIKIWGIASQFNMLAEESAELAVAALHMNRDSKNKAEMRLKLAKEIADVQICSEQIIQFLELGSLVEHFKEQKLRRLERMLLGLGVL